MCYGAIQPRGAQLLCKIVLTPRWKAKNIDSVCACHAKSLISAGCHFRLIIDKTNSMEGSGILNHTLLDALDPNLLRYPKAHDTSTSLSRCRWRGKKLNQLQAPRQELKLKLKRRQAPARCLDSKRRVLARVQASLTRAANLVKLQLGLWLDMLFRLNTNVRLFSQSGQTQKSVLDVLL